MRSPVAEVLFLDMLEVAAVDGLPIVPRDDEASSQPGCTPGAPGAFDDLRAHAYGEVLREDGQFRMWYSALSAAERDEPPRKPDITSATPRAGMGSGG